MTSEEVTGSVSSAQHSLEDGPTSSLRHVSMCKEQCAVVASFLKLKLWGGGRLAGLTQHHEGDGLASSLGPVCTGTEPRVACSGSLVAKVVVAVLSQLGLSPSRV